MFLGNIMDTKKRPENAFLFYELYIPVVDILRVLTLPVFRSTRCSVVVALESREESGLGFMNITHLDFQGLKIFIS